MASRRRLLLSTGAALAGVAAAPFVQARSREDVVVVTNHNDDLVGPVEEAFERQHPRHRLRIRWLMPAEALPALRQRSAPADVWWEAAPMNHLADLAREGLLLPLEPDGDRAPQSLAGLSLWRPGQPYRATQLSLMPFLVNDGVVHAGRLPAPDDWPALAAADYAGQIVLADPRTTRFSAKMAETVLQGFGWTGGWALLSAICANSRLQTSPVAEEVTAGRCAVALEVDISPNADQRLRMPIRWVYPRHGGLLAAGFCGVLAQSSNPPAAQAFCRFLVSPGAQRLLPATGAPRLPVHPDAYDGVPATALFNPFQAADDQRLANTLTASARRVQFLLAAWSPVLDQHEQHAALWQRLRRAESALGGPPTEPLRHARALLEAPPCGEAEARDIAESEGFAPVPAATPRVPEGQREENFRLNIDPARKALRPQAQQWLDHTARRVHAGWAECDALLRASKG